MEPDELRAIAAKMRERNPAPRRDMQINHYYRAAGVYALIEGIEALAEEMETGS